MIEVSWRWLQETFGFEAPQQSKKEVPWHLKFDGDLRWLDLRGMLESIGYRARPIGGKDAVFCPWRAEHTTGIEETAASGSTVIWQSGADRRGRGSSACMRIVRGAALKNCSSGLRLKNLAL
jgi:hypothetical protein